MAIRFCQPFFLMEMYSVKCVLVILSLSFSWPRSTTKNGDLGHNAGGSLLCLFKILVSREGRPRPVWRVASRQDSNPLPLSRGETHSARGGLFGIEFQSTPLSRGETAKTANFQSLHLKSIMQSSQSLPLLIWNYPDFFLVFANYILHFQCESTGIFMCA